MMLNIYTHKEVDLDAASSVALAMLVAKHENKEYRIHFVNADIKIDDIITNNNLILDIEAGIKGEIEKKDNITRRLSAFSSYLDTLDEVYKEIYKKLAVYVDAVDSGKYTVKKNAISEREIFSYIKEFNKDDHVVVQRWSEVLEGMYEHELVHRMAKEEIKKAKIYGDIAIINNPRSKQTASILRNMYPFVIYSSGFNLGILMPNDLEIGFYEKLKNALPEWFHHPGRFISCYGSYKAPKDTSCGYTSEDIKQIIEEIYE